MSEQEVSKGEEIDIDRAARFFGALLKYFRRYPKAMTGVLHGISENLADTIIENGELRNHLGVVAGQLKLLSNLIWDHDDNEVIQQVITSSPNLEDIMDVIAQLAWTYDRLEGSTSIIPGEIENVISGANATLLRIIELIIREENEDS